MRPDPLLAVDDLRIAYGPVLAVRGAALQVGRGEVVALLGANGAGKSSTLRAISGLQPCSGQIHFDGIDCTRTSPDRLARAGLIHVPEGRRIFPTLSVAENLQVAGAARSRRRGAFVVDDVYDLFPMLVPLRQRGGWALSGGEQQMLAIGRALLGAPRLLLLDEPSLGLAPAVVRTVFAALAQISAEVPMLLVEQNTVVALGACTHGYVMSGGRIVLSGTAAELRAGEALLDSYLGQGDVDTEDAAGGDDPVRGRPG